MLVEYKGNTYQLLGIVKMKVGENWVKAAQYESNLDGQIYVRELSDFASKFKVIGNDVNKFYFALEHGYNIKFDGKVYGALGVAANNDAILVTSENKVVVVDIEETSDRLEVIWNE